MKKLFEEKEYNNLSEEELSQYKDAYSKLDAWIKPQGLTKKERANYNQIERELLELIIEGMVEINEKNNISYNLSMPILDSDGEVAYDSITFDKRILVSELEKAQKDTNQNSDIAQTLMYAALSSGMSKAVLRKLAAKDMKRISNIVVYFL